VKNLVDKSAILEFIKDCVRERRIVWTYHVTMRLQGRFISRESILAGVESFEIIEEYPDDKYLPSFLVFAKTGEEVFHIHIAVDRQESQVRIITTYRPTPDRWQRGFRRRKR
jgi:hypothetical protein